MIKKLQPHGNSLALVIDKTMMEVLHLTPDTPVQVTIHGDSMTIRSANIGIPEEELKAQISEIRPRYKKMLENLAK